MSILKYIIAFGLLVAIHGAMAQNVELQALYTKAMEAHRKGDNQTFYTSIREALAIHPYHQGLLYQAGIAATLNNKKDEAFQYLRAALLIRTDFSLDIPDLSTLTTDPRYDALKKLQATLSHTIIHSDTLFVIRDKTLHIESITPGEKEGVFYAACIHKRKVVRVVDGEVQDIKGLGPDRPGAVFDVKMDRDGRHLWISSSPMPEMEDAGQSAASAVIRYDTREEKIADIYLPMNTTEELIFGSLAFDPAGEVYVSDSKSNLIFRVDRKQKKLIQYHSSEEFWNIQGLAFSPDGKFMFVADYVKGIFRIDRKNFEAKLLQPRFDMSLKSVDGLVFYKNTLIAIQNGVFPMRVVQYTLSKSMDQLTGYTIIDQAHPAFHEPTQGSLSGDVFYYVAGSYWEGYDETRALKPDSQLKEVAILKTNLKMLTRK